MQAIYKQKCMENVRNRLQSLPWVYSKAAFGLPARQVCVLGSSCQAEGVCR